MSERRLLAAASAYRNDADAARRYLKDRSPAVRAAALGALVELGELGEDEVARLRHDPSALVRRRLCELAGRLLNMDFSPLLHDEDPLVLEAACFALGETGDSSELSRLCELASDHRDPLCREAAIAALGAIGDERAKGVVLKALSDIPAIRRRATVALAAFSGSDVERALRERLEDRDWQVRQAAADVLGLSGSERR